MSSTEIAAAAGLRRRAISRETLIVAAALALAAALAWAWLLSAPMAMAMEPWSAGYLLPAFAMWEIMMVAMMLPSAAPMILLHGRIDRAPAETQRLLNTVVFASAYLAVWAVFSALAAAAQALLISADLLSAMSLSLNDGTIIAALLVAAAAYEVTSAKRLCLDKCQSPLVFIMRHHRPGAAGAFRLGILHGLFCLGCCWALMLLLFAGGVMNLAWVAALGAIVLVEKMAPPAWHAHRWIAAVLIAGAMILLSTT